MDKTPNHTTLIATLRDTELGAAQYHHGITVFPLFPANVSPGSPGSASVPNAPSGPDVAGISAQLLSLSRALESNLVEIREIGESGSVPELQVINGSDRLVLGLDGEEIVGAKQNRVLQTTILFAPRSETLIPVNCVEAGRWQYTGNDKFAHSGYHMSKRQRSRKVRSVNVSLHAAQSFAGDQNETWDGISEMNQTFACESPTGASKDVYAMTARLIHKYLQAFPCTEGQTGLLVLNRNGGVEGFDLTSNASVYGDNHTGLLRSYLTSVLMEERLQGRFSPNEVISDTGGEDRSSAHVRELQDKGIEFIRTSFAESKTHAFDGVGLGQELRFDEDTSVGSALIWQDAVMHCTCFQHDERSRIPGRGNRAWSRRIKSRRFRSTPQNPDDNIDR